MELTAENKNRYQALAYTVGFHLILLLLLIFIVFDTPIPPFEEKNVPEAIVELGGMEGLGSVAAGGSGHNDKDIASSPDKVKTTHTSATAPNVMTDETETDSYVKANPKNKKEKKAETPAVTEEKEDAEYAAAIAKMKAKRQHKGSGEGPNATGGSGTGTSTGVGTAGGDSGIGNGNRGGNGGTGGYELGNRKLLMRPAKMTDAEESGIVVVEIIVDENGKVIHATPGLPRSTTLSAKLFSKARQAVMQAKFSPSLDGKAEQRGTYTIVFELN